MKDSKMPSYTVIAVKENLLKALDLIERIERGEKNESCLTYIDTNLETTRALLKINGFDNKVAMKILSSED